MPTRPSILIVDDEIDILTILKRCLGYLAPHTQICACKSTDEALRRINDISPSLVLADYVMPGMDGLAFIDIIRTMAPNVPVALITGHPYLSLMTQCDARGITYIPKPFRLEAIERLLDRAGLTPRPAAT